MIGVLAKKKKSTLTNNLEELSFQTALEDCDQKQSEISELILNEVDSNTEVLDFIKKYFNFCLETNYITSTSTKFNIEKLGTNEFSGIVNLKKINDTRYINKFFELN